MGSKNLQEQVRKYPENSIVSSESVTDVLLLVKLTLRQPFLSCSRLLQISRADLSTPLGFFSSKHFSTGRIPNYICSIQVRSKEQSLINFSSKVFVFYSSGCWKLFWDKLIKICKLASVRLSFHIVQFGIRQLLFRPEFWSEYMNICNQVSGILSEFYYHL